MTISDWPLAERPREKLLALGSRYLTDAELIAIFLRTGVRGKTALDLARELMSEFGDLRKLVHTDFLYQKPGIGKAKWAMLKAAFELGRRCLEVPLKPGEALANSSATKLFLASRLGNYPHEVFACLFLDNQNRVIAFEELFQGTLSEASIYPREVIKRCLAQNAAKVIFAHNHPSGNPNPSQADREITQMLKDSLALIDIQVIDHIVIGNEGCISFAEVGFL